MKTEKEKMLSGEPYSANDQELVKERLRARELIIELDSIGVLDSAVAKRVRNELIPHAPENLYIQTPFHCDYGYNISCGDNVFFNANCVILDVVPVTIGSNVLFGPAVQIYTAAHPLNHMERRSVEYGLPVTIGNDSWIGGGAIILPGVNIGERCIIGAGAVVTKDIPNDSIAVGNPARARPIK